jgi:hypothetical protein
MPIPRTDLCRWRCKLHGPHGWTPESLAGDCGLTTRRGQPHTPADPCEQRRTDLNLTASQMTGFETNTAWDAAVNPLRSTTATK